MGIWQYSANNPYVSVFFVEFQEHELSKHFRKRPILKWENIWVASSSQTEIDEIPDFVWTSALFPIMSKKAVDVLSPLIAKHVQFLPLRWYPDEAYELFAVNVLTSRDYLDEEKTQFRYRANGEVMNIIEYAFIEDCVVDVPIFKLHIYSEIVFVSDIFKRKVDEAGLVGLTLEKMK